MNMADFIIRPYRDRDESAVIALWQRCNLTRPWNNPKLDIERMLKVYPDLFLVGLIDDSVVAAVMGGYDGHRGWVYYLGVAPEHQRRGYGRQMMDAVTRQLTEIGCPKINIQVRSDNKQALGFYAKIGYTPEDRVSLGRRLVED
jgi:ribosomal protein S18 acetylase RimI-like enzyme